MPLQCAKAPIWTQVTPAYVLGLQSQQTQEPMLASGLGGNRAGLLHHPTPVSLQHSALPSVNPYLHCPQRAGMMMALQAVVNQASGAAGRQGKGTAHAHRGARLVIPPIWRTPDPSPGSPSPWSCWLGGITPGWKGPSPPPGLQRATPSRNCSCPSAAEGQSASSTISAVHCKGSGITSGDWGGTGPCFAASQKEQLQV